MSRHKSLDLIIHPLEIGVRTTLHIPISKLFLTVQFSEETTWWLE